MDLRPGPRILMDFIKPPEGEFPPICKLKSLTEETYKRVSFIEKYGSVIIGALLYLIFHAAEIRECICFRYSNGVAFKKHWRSSIIYVKGREKKEVVTILHAPSHPFAKGRIL